MCTGPIDTFEIEKITLEIWNSYYGGSNYGPKIEIISQNGEKRQTLFHGPFSKGTTLIWDKNGENRYGHNNLGGVSGFRVKPFLDTKERSQRYYTKFRIIGGGGDDFSPKMLTIYSTDGMQYNSFHGRHGRYIRFWTDNVKGNFERKAENPRPLGMWNGNLEWMYQNPSKGWHTDREITRN